MHPELSVSAGPEEYPTPFEIFDEELERALHVDAITSALAEPGDLDTAELRAAARDRRERLIADVAAEEQAYLTALSDVRAALRVDPIADPASMADPSAAPRHARSRLYSVALWWVFGALLTVGGGAAVLLAVRGLTASWALAWTAIGCVVLIVISSGMTLNASRKAIRRAGNAGLGLIAAGIGLAIGYHAFVLAHALELPVWLRIASALAAPILAVLLLGFIASRAERFAPAKGSGVDRPDVDSALGDREYRQQESYKRARRQAHAALGELREALLNRAILGFLRRFIDERREAKYGVTLIGGDWNGLWSARFENYHVPTAASAELTRVVDRLGVRGGSIGLFGPRGAGKTHLIQAFCGRLDVTQEDLAVVVAAPVDYHPREFVLHIDAMLCQAALKRVGRADVVAAADRPPGWSLWRQIKGMLARGPVDGEQLPQTGLHSIAGQIRRHQRGLFYLSRHSNEVSGKVSAASVVEAGVTHGRGLEEQPHTYPEIVQSFRAMLEDIVQALADTPRDPGGRPPRVIIGIDDLDRIESAERARSFLHEIKAIFGVHGCFFLVSVSDEAMSAFNRDGVFQTTFDTTFDEQVRVDRLGWSTSRQILVQRSLGMSEPFRLLAYCLAGGPARALVRVARAIAVLDEARRHEDRSPLRLAEVSAQLVAAETTGLCQGMQPLLARYEWHPSVTDAIIALDDVERGDVSALVLAALIDRLRVVGAEVRELWELVHASSTRLYFLLTVIEIFTDNIEIHRLTEANRSEAGSSPFDELARAGSDAQASPLMAWLAIDRVRLAFQLPLLDWRRPADVQAGTAERSG